MYRLHLIFNHPPGSKRVLRHACCLQMTRFCSNDSPPCPLRLTRSGNKHCRPSQHNLFLVRRSTPLPVQALALPCTSSPRPSVLWSTRPKWREFHEKPRTRSTDLNTWGSVKLPERSYSWVSPSFLENQSAHITFGVSRFSVCVYRRTQRSAMKSPIWRKSSWKQRRSGGKETGIGTWNCQLHLSSSYVQPIPSCSSHSLGSFEFSGFCWSHFCSTRPWQRGRYHPRRTRALIRLCLLWH